MSGLPGKLTVGLHPIFCGGQDIAQARVRTARAWGKAGEELESC
jgi:hypothetical protein